MKQEIVGDIVGQAHVACLMCLGHNKGWEEAVSLLVVRLVLKLAVLVTRIIACLLLVKLLTSCCCTC